MNVVQLAPETVDRRALLAALRALRKGDFSTRMPLDLVGVDAEIAAAFNDIVDMNECIANELTRLGEEVGKQGRISQRMRVRAAVGSWARAVDSVNTLTPALTRPTAAAANVIESVANGTLSQRMPLEIDGVPLRGEFQRIGAVVNAMVDQLSGFASEVSRVAREVGTEGKLGGQAHVPGVAGTWKDLTENVNQLAANLTTQVRAIAEVATAVTKGDLTRSITVEVQGEVAVLKDTINEMIRNLKDTTQKNSEQDWLKTNLAKFSRMLQGQKDLLTVGRLILSELAPVVGAQQAEFYVLNATSDAPRLRLFASYASGGQNTHGREVHLGEGVVGQCAVEKQKILLTNVPTDYFHISSGLGDAAPRNILVLPVIFEGAVKGILELAS